MLKSLSMCNEVLSYLLSLSLSLSLSWILRTGHNVLWQLGQRLIGQLLLFFMMKIAEEALNLSLVFMMNTLMSLCFMTNVIEGTVHLFPCYVSWQMSWRVPYTCFMTDVMEGTVHLLGFMTNFMEGTYYFSRQKL